MKKYFYRIKSKQTGDTIVEVLICLTVLAVVMATVYGISARSLTSSTEAKKRTEALSLAQSQVDFLTAAQKNDSNFAADYQKATAYCIATDGTIDNSAKNNSDKLCDGYGSSVYNIGIKYQSNIFTITAQWDAGNAPGGLANLNLYYKLPG